jgi:signal transduction histidine kinase
MDPSLSLLQTMERILAIEATDLRSALRAAADHAAAALGAEKVDVFLHEPERSTLVAVGVSSTPLAARERSLGLDLCPIANGGRAVLAFQSGEPFITGRADADPLELRGIVDGLGVRSTMHAPIDVAGERRGVLGIASTRPDAWDATHLQFVCAIARWIGLVVHRAEVVERLAARAEEAGRRAAAEELVMVVAHDLRNYLSPVQGRIELLRQRAIREAREKDHRDADAAHRSVRRLAGLVSDLLDVGRIEQGLFSLERVPLDLVALLRDVIAAIEAPGRRIALAAPAEIVVDGDATRLRQVLENLLSNASKHTAEGLAIAVEAEVLGEGRHRVARVAVSNPGPRIDPALASRVFTRYARDPGSEGLGLGLYLAREIAVAHGGSLALDASFPEGTCFVLRLPVHDA